MWRDICVANRDELLPMLDHYLVELHRLRQLIEASDSAGVEKLFADAKAVRDALYRPATSQS
jgi:prephenate dehydrogenase